MKSPTSIATCINCEDCLMQEFFTSEELKKIESNRSEIKFNQGDIILKQGTFISQVLYLKKGLVKIVLEGRNERHTILKLVNAQNYIVLPVLGSSDVYPYSVIALTDSVVCHIRKETFNEISNSNINFNKHLLNWFSMDYLYMYNKISVAGTRNNHGKLAWVLMYLDEYFSEENVFELITRKDLAELASISVESVNKILLELKHDKIIEIDGKTIRILSPELIEKLSTVG